MEDPEVAQLAQVFIRTLSVTNVVCSPRATRLAAVARLMPTCAMARIVSSGIAEGRKPAYHIRRLT